MTERQRLEEGDPAGRPRRAKGRVPPKEPAKQPRPPAAPALDLLGVQRAAGNSAVVGYLQAKGAISAPGDPHEEHADRSARAVLSGAPPETAPAARPGSDPGVDAGVAALGEGQPLGAEVREFMEPRFGADFGDVRVHTDGAAQAANAALGADAFTYGHDVYFGPGRAPGVDPLTAHELSHVVQQRSAKRIQPSFTGSHGVALGVFEIDMQTVQGAVNTPPTHSGLDGYMRFVPHNDAPNSNVITIVQIVRTTNLAGADIDSASTPPAQAPRGALGDPGLRTEEDSTRGVEGGFKTDVHHRPHRGAPGLPEGSPLSPRYNFQPAPAGATGIGATAQPAQYGGGVGGVVGQTPGFKRSNDAADIRSAAMYDRPGVASAAVDFNMDFETVAKGEDTMVVYGAVRWGFGIRSGRVVNEYFHVVDTQTATFDEALERHRDFYVHEPVTFYFPFDSDVLDATETAKIATFTAYLGRNTSHRLSLEGFADVRGGASAHNVALAGRRANAVVAALVAAGVDPGRIDTPTVSGASTAATLDAGTGDQGGNAAVGADQTREANRWANRRVVLTFYETMSHAPPGGGP